jgi:hypothetical protein
LSGATLLPSDAAPRQLAVARPSCQPLGEPRDAATEAALLPEHIRKTYAHTGSERLKRVEAEGRAAVAELYE